VLAGYRTPSLALLSSDSAPDDSEFELLLAQPSGTSSGPLSWKSWGCSGALSPRWYRSPENSGHSKGDRIVIA